MSVYREIKTEFKNFKSLKKALEDFGLDCICSPDGKTNTVEVKSNYHNGNLLFAALFVERRSLEAKIGHVFGGLGFAWNGAGYDLVVDNLDEQKHNAKKLLDGIRQRYAYHEIKRQAWERGYSLVESKTSDGTIRLQLRSMS